MKPTHYWELSCQHGAVIGLAAVPPGDVDPAELIMEWLVDMRDGDMLRKWPISRPTPEFGECACVSCQPQVPA